MSDVDIPDDFQPHRLTIGGSVRLVWCPSGASKMTVLKTARDQFPGQEISTEPPPTGWPTLADLCPDGWINPATVGWTLCDASQTAVDAQQATLPTTPQENPSPSQERSPEAMKTAKTALAAIRRQVAGDDWERKQRDKAALRLVK